MASLHLVQTLAQVHPEVLLPSFLSSFVRIQIHWYVHRLILLQELVRLCDDAFGVTANAVNDLSTQVRVQALSMLGNFTHASPKSVG